MYVCVSTGQGCTLVTRHEKNERESQGRWNRRKLNIMSGADINGAVIELDDIAAVYLHKKELWYCRGRYDEFIL